MEDKKLKCSHCNLNVLFEPFDESSWAKNNNKKARNEEVAGITEIVYDIYGISYGHCPSCENLIVFYLEGENRTQVDKSGKPSSYENWVNEEIIFPKHLTRILSLKFQKNIRRIFLKPVLFYK